MEIFKGLAALWLLQASSMKARIAIVIWHYESSDSELLLQSGAPPTYLYIFFGRASEVARS